MRRVHGTGTLPLTLKPLTQKPQFKPNPCGTLYIWMPIYILSAQYKSKTVKVWI
jgi:hypothetical protein